MHHVLLSQGRSPSRRKATDIRFALKVSRPGFWLTSAWFYLLPLGQQDVWESFPFWAGLVYVTFPLGFLLYGWNDLADYETDRRNPRKDSYLFGARGSRSQLKRLPLQIGLVQLPFVALFTWLLGVKAILWFLAVLASNAIYNAPRFGFKAHPFLDLLNQAGYLLVFVLSAWLNGAPQLSAPGFVFGALFAMHSHLLGQIMDLEPDRTAGRRTTAVVMGIVPAKLLMFGLLSLEWALMVRYFSDPYLAAFFAICALWLLGDALIFQKERPYRTAQMRFFLIFWNGIALVSIPWVWLNGSFLG